MTLGAAANMWANWFDGREICLDSWLSREYIESVVI